MIGVLRYAVERLQVIEKKFSILEPQKVTLIIGSKKKKLTDYQNEIKAIQSKLGNETNLPSQEFKIYQS